MGEKSHHQRPAAMRRRRAAHSVYQCVFACLCFPSLIACSHQPYKDAVPAVLDNPTSETVAGLKAMLHRVTKQRDLKLADSIFQKSSVLGIERQHLIGLALDMPIRFQLMKSGDTCFLKKIGEDHIWPLEKVDCKPE